MLRRSAACDHEPYVVICRPRCFGRTACRSDFDETEAIRAVRYFLRLEERMQVVLLRRCRVAHCDLDLCITSPHAQRIDRAPAVRFHLAELHAQTTLCYARRFTQAQLHRIADTHYRRRGIDHLGLGRPIATTRCGRSRQNHHQLLHHSSCFPSQCVHLLLHNVPARCALPLALASVSDAPYAACPWSLPASVRRSPTGRVASRSLPAETTNAL